MKQQIHFQSRLIKGDASGAQLKFTVLLSPPVLLRQVLPSGFAICLYLN